MSYKNSIKKLNIKIQQKNMLVVSGNIHDFQIDSSGREFLSLVDGIVKDFEEEYKQISLFSPSKGEIDLTDDNNKEDQKEDDLGIVGDNTTPSTVEEFLMKTIKSISEYDYDESNKKIFIIDFTDVYFDNSNTNTGAYQSIANLLSSVISTNSNKVSNLASSNNQKIIFLQRDSGTLINLIKDMNVEYTNVVIQKPDMNERRDVLRSTRTFLRISNSEKFKNVDSKELNEAVALTDGWSIREIIQLGRIDFQQEEDPTFKERFNLASFNKKDSEWEKIEFSKIKELKKNISDNVFGQKYAVETVAQIVKKSFLGLSGLLHSETLNKPKGILFFCGPTGVGKTELSKVIAKEIFGDENRLIRFDMSEYNLEHSDQRLIGAPPGYVGYNTGGQLTNAVKEKPFSVLLFDEIEKAHSKVMDKFLQILEDGRLTSSQGEIINFSETLIIFTSNIGQENTDPKNSSEVNRRQTLRELETFFTKELKRPELLNRIGKQNLIPFDYLTDKTIQLKLIKNKMKKVIQTLSKRDNISLSINAEEYNNILTVVLQNYDEKMGGRGIMNSLEVALVTPLTEHIFDNYEQIKKTRDDNKIHNITLQVKDSKLIFSSNS